MRILRVALAAVCAAVLLARPGIADEASPTAAAKGSTAPVPATLPLPPPLPPGKTAVAAVTG